MTRRRLVVPAVLIGLALAVVVGGVAFRSRPASGPPALTFSRVAVSEARIGEMASVFMVVDDAGGPDTLVSATTDAAAAVTVHDTETTADSAVMAELGTLRVPGGGAVELVPGGRHLMLHHVYAPLVPGATIELVLQFERSGPISLQVPVLAYADLADLADGATGG